MDFGRVRGSRHPADIASEPRRVMSRSRPKVSLKRITRGERRVLLGLLILAHVVLSWTFFEQVVVNALGRPHPATVVKAESVI